MHTHAILRTPPQQDSLVTILFKIVFWGFLLFFEEEGVRRGRFMRKIPAIAAFIWALTTVAGLKSFILDGNRDGFFEMFLIMGTALYFTVGLELRNNRRKASQHFCD